MNQSAAAAARRHIVELEKRVAAQCALIEQLVAANRDASQATRTFRVLEDALSLTKEHLRFLVRDETKSPLHRSDRRQSSRRLDRAVAAGD